RSAVPGAARRGQQRERPAQDPHRPHAVRLARRARVADECNPLLAAGGGRESVVWRPCQRPLVAAVLESPAGLQQQTKAAITGGVAASCRCLRRKGQRQLWLPRHSVGTNGLRVDQRRAERRTAILDRDTGRVGADGGVSATGRGRTLVGRVAERAILTGCLRSTLEGQRQVLLVTG